MLLLCLRGKARDEARPKAAVRNLLPNVGDDLLELLFVRVPAHQLQNPVAAVLDRKV